MGGGPETCEHLNEDVVHPKYSGAIGLTSTKLLFL